MFLLTVNFLSELAQNNNKAWFEANRTRYEREVRAPAVAFVEAIAPRLAVIAPQLRAECSFFSSEAILLWVIVRTVLAPLVLT